MKKNNDDKMYESGEDYLEAILMIQNEKGECHSVDVARKLDVSRPSVSRAMGILRDEGYIFFDDSQHIKFTKKGLEKSSEIYDRHQLLTKFFARIADISEEQAEKNACRVEHVIDSDVVEGIRRFMQQ